MGDRKSSDSDLAQMRAIIVMVYVCVVMCVNVAKCADGSNNSTGILDQSGPRRTPVKIAVLLPNDDTSLFAIHRVSPAISVAIDRVEEAQLIPSLQLSVKYADSFCNIALSMNEAIKFYIQREVNVFMGPACDFAAAPVARQCKFWKLPIVTPGAMHRDFGRKERSYSYLTRIGHNIGSLGGFLVSVFTAFNWSRVTLVYDPHGRSDIMQQYCHITMDGLHYEFKDGYPDLNIFQDYSKFDVLTDITDNLPKVVGNEFSRPIIDLRSISTEYDNRNRNCTVEKIEHYLFSSTISTADVMSDPSTAG